MFKNTMIDAPQNEAFGSWELLYIGICGRIWKDGWKFVVANVCVLSGAEEAV